MGVPHNQREKARGQRKPVSGNRRHVRVQVSFEPNHPDQEEAHAMKLAMITALILIIVASIEGAERPYLDAAVRAARWIESSSLKTAKGTAWPSDPHDPKTVETNLYSGVPGVVLFFLETYRATGDRAFLMEARGGADFLLASMDDEHGDGLYEGLAGCGFALEETFKVSGDAKYQEGARACVKRIREDAQSPGRGVQWSDTTDIISGNSGTGLFLLYAAHELSDPAARELAAQAGERLIEIGKPEGLGMKWSMDPKFPRLMPNFSHGTAGIAYFLATLYTETKKKEFLDAALSGARYLLSVANTEGNVCLIFHDGPDGKQLYYLGWCHGPVGTARLFYRLYQITGEQTWMDWVKKSARGIMMSGVPEKLTPGFWNNVSACCGSASVADFFLDLYKVTRDRQYLDYCRRVMADLLKRGTREGNGIKWTQAEHRVKPDLLVAQTGYMQGAAGIGMFLLRFDNFERGRKEEIIFPDSPFVSPLKRGRKGEGAQTNRPRR
jgi:lantibiotic modifying enzyme